MELQNNKYAELKNLDNLRDNIPNNSVNKNICVFGQGFVGLPLTLSFALRGCQAVGVEIDDILVANINKGITHHTEKFYGVSIQEILKSQLACKRYVATTDAIAAMKKSNNIIVTVGIPINNGKHVMDYLQKACTIIGGNLKKDDLVIIRSTVIPGTTEEFILPILERESQMKAGKDFYLAYASERIAEGNAFEEFANMPTLVGAINKKSLERAKAVLAIVCKAEVVRASGIKAVETSKVFENVQRDLNIAMSQEFARFTEALGIDIFEVIKLANTHKRVNLLTPGSGVGGYCIPNAYYYLAPKAEEMGIGLEVLKLAREKNEKIPEFIIEKVEALLKSVGKSLEGSVIAVLGLAMKDYSNDDRISPPVEICKGLIEKGAVVRAYDPMVNSNYNFKVKTQDEALRGADLMLITALQKSFEFDNIQYIIDQMADRPICVDTKNIIDIKKLKNADLVYWKI